MNPRLNRVGCTSLGNVFYIYNYETYKRSMMKAVKWGRTDEGIIHIKYSKILR